MLLVHAQGCDLGGLAHCVSLTPDSACQPIMPLPRPGVYTVARPRSGSVNARAFGGGFYGPARLTGADDMAGRGARGGAPAPGAPWRAARAGGAAGSGR